MVFDGGYDDFLLVLLMERLILVSRLLVCFFSIILVVWMS
jgi:hypothetical protein